MIDQRHSASETCIEPDVRNAYRCSAVESTPASLNQQILKVARLASRDRSILPTTKSWVRPLAFAAMAVLSLTVVIQLQSPGLVEIAPESPSHAVKELLDDSEGRAGDLAAAVESTGEHLRRLNSAAESLNSNNKPIPSAAPLPSTRLDLPGQPSDADPVYCETESKTSAESWWQCIQGLQRNGMADAARGEIDRFRSTHPSFETN